MELVLKILQALVGLASLSGIILYDRTDRRLEQTFDVTPEVLAVMPDSQLVERGRHLATAVMVCTECHGQDLGGEVMISNPAIGRLVASNLTRGEDGIGRRYTDSDFERAIRHGIDPLGRPLVGMPSMDYQHMSDEDLAAVIAFLRQAPPVDRHPGDLKVGPATRLALATGMLPILAAEHIDHDAPKQQAPVPGPTAEYGAYLVSVAGCRGCHGPNLDGGKDAFPGVPGITQRRLGGWTEAHFFQALRQGVRPHGSPIDSQMPWPSYSRMKDAEVRAIWLYLKTLS